MELKFLGRGSAFNVKEGNTSAYYKEGFDMLLIDCGSTVFSKIVEKNILNDVHDLYIAITHSHPDHIGSLGDLIFYCYYALRIRVHILYGNNRTKEDIIKYFEACGVENYMYHFLDKVFPFGSDSMFVAFGKCKHVHNLPSYNLFIFYNDKQIFYSGDCCELSYECDRNLLVQFNTDRIYKSDLIYIECSYYDKLNSVHFSLNSLYTMFFNLKHKVFCMHFDCDKCIEECKEYGFNIVEVE